MMTVVGVAPVDHPAERDVDESGAPVDVGVFGEEGIGRPGAGLQAGGGHRGLWTACNTPEPPLGRKERQRSQGQVSRRLFSSH